jgi:hypothetical protein
MQRLESRRHLLAYPKPRLVLQPLEHAEVLETWTIRSLEETQMPAVGTVHVELASIVDDMRMAWCRGICLSEERKNLFLMMAEPLTQIGAEDFKSVERFLAKGGLAFHQPDGRRWPEAQLVVDDEKTHVRFEPLADVDGTVAAWTVRIKAFDGAVDHVWCVDLARERSSQDRQ